MFKIFSKALLLNLVFTTLAFAQEAGAAEPSISQALGKMVPMFIMLFFIWYFLVIKPQQSKAKEHATLLETLKKGDQVVTTGGIIGRVSNTEVDHVVLDISGNAKLKIEPNHILKKYEKASAAKSKAA